MLSLEHIAAEISSSVPGGETNTRTHSRIDTASVASVPTRGGPRAFPELLVFFCRCDWGPTLSSNMGQILVNTLQPCSVLDNVFEAVSKI